MCIYYTDKKNLNYKSQDHILLAGLGGITELPRGYVSDEFNHSISSLELSFLRNSFVAVARAFDGPGKRGKLGDKHQTKSKINVFKNASTEYPFSLGYMKKGKTYLIPHFIYNSITEKIISFGLDTSLQQNSIYDFIEKCKKTSLLNIRTIYDEEIPTDLILFGIVEDVEKNFNGFIAANKDNITTLTKDCIQQVISSINLQKDIPLIKTPYTPRLSVAFDENHFRVFAKMAFNCLADLKGIDFVKENKFDRIRQWIITGGKNEFVFLNVDNYNPFTNLGIQFTNSEHFVWICTIQNTLVAFINLYNRAGTIIRLCENFGEQIQGDGLVCNWNCSTPREYSVSEYIQQHSSSQTSIKN